MLTLLHKSRMGVSISGRCLHDSVVTSHDLPFLANPTPVQDSRQAPSGSGGCHPKSTMMASSGLVFLSAEHGNRSLPSAPSEGHPHTGQREDIPPRSPVTTSNSVENPHSIEHILLAARKPSTRTLYAYKWNMFTQFTLSKALSLCHTTLEALLFCIIYSSKASLIPPLRCMWPPHQPLETQVVSLFRHPTLKTFLKGIRNICPRLHNPTPQWSLLVLQRLMHSPFEPMATTSEWLLSLKTTFLVAIMSSRRASKLVVLRVDLPYLQFQPNKVTLFPDVSFMPKVVTDFHLNQTIALPSFTYSFTCTLHLLTI